MKLKKFLKNFCIDDGVNENVDILVFDKSILEEYKKEGVPNTFGATEIASEAAGTLFYGIMTENVHPEKLMNFEANKLDPMKYILDLPVRLVCEPHNDNAVLGIIVEEYEPEDIMHKTKDVRIEIKDDNGKVVSAGGMTKEETFTCYRKLVDIKNRKKQALKAVRPKKNAKVKKVKKDAEKSKTPSSETAK